MYKKIAAWLVPVLAIAIVGIGYWGYTLFQTKEALYNTSENNYQRAFFDLGYFVDSIQDELGKTIAVSTPGQFRKSLSNVWRLSYAAQARIGHLPLGIMDFSQTEEFLARVGDFTYRAAVRNLDVEPITEEEWQTLKQLYQCASTLQGEIRGVQSVVLNENLKWTDFELMSLKQNPDEPLDNHIVNGFSTLEEEVNHFPEIQWGTGIDTIKQIRQEKIKRLEGENFTEEMVRKKVTDFLDLGPEKNFEIVRNPDGGEFNTYSVYVTNGDEDIIYLDVMERAGNILWLLHDRNIGRPTMDLQEAEQKAVEYLQKLKVTNAIATNIDDYENIAVISFSSLVDDIVVYPDTITVKIALDNGEIVGFASEKFLLNHTERDIESPQISIDDASKRLNQRLQVEEQRMAIIEADDGREVLTYEFIGTIDNNTYKIYLNVENGEEEKVEKVEQVGLLRVNSWY
ncbi:germination protein YpeB [Desulfuribacillus stibiiarsenatis]|uniref:Germination protein YpeB n=1 Tax=Desulfuribacillus stibiiarsenatis TaxID=1390249 RepID=A0A1E5L3V1_9FIRM|nr:germination protein YpeB [Desulfuribacillus stibiiarsenatis]OEH84771.1 germination protein YpeB [Desulfuribacillus stibiiarsenatis]